MINRELVGKTYPAFPVMISAAFNKQLLKLFHAVPSANAFFKLPYNWPTILAIHGTTSLMAVWEDIGIDPLDVRLISEEFSSFRNPGENEKLSGQIHVENISQRVEPDTGIEDQIDLIVDFRDPSYELIANYRSSYRIPFRTGEYSSY